MQVRILSFQVTLIRRLIWYPIVGLTLANIMVGILQLLKVFDSHANHFPNRDRRPATDHRGGAVIVASETNNEKKKKFTSSSREIFKSPEQVPTKLGSATSAKQLTSGILSINLLQTLYDTVFQTICHTFEFLK